MSDSKSKKDPNPDSPHIFTLDLDHSGSSGDVPDIADLLGNSKKPKRKEAPVSHPEKTDRIEPNAVRFMVKSLQEFDTQIEIHFIQKEEGFHYLQHSTLGNHTFIGMDEILQNMKIPNSFLSNPESFMEFQSKEKGWLFDAFGMSTQPFLQMVLHQGNKVLTVYGSGKTMHQKKEAIVAYTEHKNKNLSASVVDLDIAS